MSLANQIGPVMTGGMFERAIVAHLLGKDPVTGGSWMATALGEVERAEGLEPGVIPQPRDVVTSSQFKKMPEDQLPCILVMTTGFADPPVKRGDGTLTLTWALGVMGVVPDLDKDSSRQVGQIYAAAIHLAMSRKPSLGIGAMTTFVDEQYGDIDFDDSRTLGSGHCVFAVRVPDARTVRGGPSRPLPDPTVDPGPWPDVTAVTTDIELTPITEDVTT